MDYLWYSFMDGNVEDQVDEDLEGDALTTEINRSKAIETIADRIIHNAKLSLDAHKAINDGLVKTAPKMLGMEVLDDSV